MSATYYTPISTAKLKEKTQHYNVSEKVQSQGVINITAKVDKGYLKPKGDEKEYLSKTEDQQKLNFKLGQVAMAKIDGNTKDLSVIATANNISIDEYPNSESLEEKYQFAGICRSDTSLSSDMNVVLAVGGTGTISVTEFGDKKGVYPGDILVACAPTYEKNKNPPKPEKDGRLEWVVKSMSNPDDHFMQSFSSIIEKTSRQIVNGVTKIFLGSYENEDRDYENAYLSMKKVTDGVLMKAYPEIIKKQNKMKRRIIGKVLSVHKNGRDVDFIFTNYK